jgi:hypothetical protein
MKRTETIQLPAFLGNRKSISGFLQKKITASINSDDCHHAAGEHVVNPPNADVPDLRNAGLFDTIPGG